MAKKKKLLGDKVKEVTTKMGVKPCKGCNERAEVLNNANRWVNKLFKVSTPLDKDQLKKWNDLNNRLNINTLTPEQQNLIVSILKDNLNMSVKPCINCGMGKWGYWIGLINDFVNNGKINKPE